MGMLEGKTTIVTGAASGLGRAIALHFAREGADVLVADIRETPIEGGVSTADLIRDEGGKGRFQHADVSSWSDIDGLVADCVERSGRLDVMVNNAATYTTTSLVDTTEAQWNRVMAVNLTGVFFGCKRAVQQMLTQTPEDEVRGRIVNLSSQQAMIASPGDPAYAVSKAGVAHLTRQIAVDYAKQQIVCNAVAPGKIMTGKPGIAVDPSLLAYSHARTPWPRLGEPADVARAALYLASGLSSYTTGVNLLVDGGWMAG